MAKAGSDGAGVGSWPKWGGGDNGHMRRGNGPRGGKAQAGR